MKFYVEYNDLFVELEEGVAGAKIITEEEAKAIGISTRWERLNIDEKSYVTEVAGLKKKEQTWTVNLQDLIPPVASNTLSNTDLTDALEWIRDEQITFE